MFPVFLDNKRRDHLLNVNYVAFNLSDEELNFHFIKVLCQEDNDIFCKHCMTDISFSIKREKGYILIWPMKDGKEMEKLYVDNLRMS